MLHPTGPGQKRTIQTPGLIAGRTHWLADNRHVVLLARDETGVLRLVLLDIEDGSLAPLGLERRESAGTLAISPDDRVALVVWPDSGDCDIVPLDGSAISKGPKFEKGDTVVAFDSGGEWVYVRPGERSLPLRIDRVHVVRGEREPWREFMPADVGGLVNLGAPVMALDGEAYAYLYIRVLSDLYLGQGLG